MKSLWFIYLCVARVVLMTNTEYEMMRTAGEGEGLGVERSIIMCVCIIVVVIAK